MKLKPQLLACAEDGQLEINNNLAENALLDMALDKERQMKNLIHYEPKYGIVRINYSISWIPLVNHGKIHRRRLCDDQRGIADGIDGCGEMGRSSGFAGMAISR